MKALAGLAVFLFAALHAGFLALEMFFWDHPVGRRVFSMTAEQSAETAVLAANQGLYNGFIAAGLLWGLIARKRDVQIFSPLRHRGGPVRRLKRKADDLTDASVARGGCAGAGVDRGPARRLVASLSFKFGNAVIPGPRPCAEPGSHLLPARREMGPGFAPRGAPRGDGSFINPLRR
jgi:hypothetical protein